MTKADLTESIYSKTNIPKKDYARRSILTDKGYSCFLRENKDSWLWQLCGKSEESS